MTPKPPDPQPGEPILVEQWQWLKEQIEAAEISVVPPLYMVDAHTIALATRPWFWAKITGSPSGTAHPWVERIPLAGGTWEDGPRSGTTSDDPAYEANLSTADLTDKHVKMQRDETSYEMRFQFGAC